MGNVINRRTLRRMIFTVRDGRQHLLDKNERELAEEVEKEFTGYLLGAIGWADFAVKWDISPGDPEDAGKASRQERSLFAWGENIINLWEWKEYIKEFSNIYGHRAVPPPCFTRQERLSNGSENNL